MPACRKVNILFTSAGRRVELLRAFRSGYEHLDLDGNIIAIDVNPLAPALHFADCPITVPLVSAPEYIPRLIDICCREDIDIIFPLIDQDIPVLSKNKAAIEETGARLAVIPHESVEIVDDKWRTAQFFRELGLPSPRSWLPDDNNYALDEFPLFIKPRHGSSAKNTFKIENKGELAFFSKYVPKPIIQEYLPGAEITNDVICDTAGSILSIVSRQCIELRNGEDAKGVTVYNEVITEACAQIVRSLSAVGPITVQCRLKEGIPIFTEINARFGGGIPLAIAAGVDFPKWLLAGIAGIAYDLPPIGSYKKGIYSTRFDDSYFIRERDLPRSSINEPSP